MIFTFPSITIQALSTLLCFWISFKETIRSICPSKEGRPPWSLQEVFVANKLFFQNYSSYNIYILIKSASKLLKLGRYVMYGHILCPQYILCPILYIQYPTHTYRAKQGCIQLYTAIHCYTQLYTAIQG